MAIIYKFTVAGSFVRFGTHDSAHGNPARALSTVKLCVIPKLVMSHRGFKRRFFGFFDYERSRDPRSFMR